MMDLRIATVNDVDALVAFAQVAESESQLVRDLLEHIESSNCYVAVVDETIVAYAFLNYTFFYNGWIGMLFVNQGLRRQGIGSALVRYLMNECRTPKLFTSTNQSNIAMQGLLAALGFERSGTIENLDDGDQELVYFKRLLDNAS